MIDLKNCLTAKEPDAGGYRDIFMKWAYPAVSRARYLSKYFLDNIQGEDKNIIQLAAELSRCNLTAMDIMANDSIELMSDGM
ncbi:hypothetical protein DPMN_164269 [Dreissena polymorpha]|uniref:Uncharacterized protein n=1 Tax=Dreissena polymorpha TaxID=45954 RepID=A0A9D4EUT9_DREPO|nr:hypothetical protein DPMN_164269 [Dreissena polymorpha]